jgi:nitronate monooxygenase
VAAVSQTGALGTLAASWTDPAVLRDQLHRVEALTAQRFCVNLVLAFEQQERLQVLLDAGAPVVSFSWGVDEALIGRTREAGRFVLVQIGDVASAVRAEAAGADAIIVQGVEAGGHVESTTPLLELLPRVRRAVAAPIVAAGGIADPAAARRAIDAGADAVACGTAFLAAREADVHEDYRRRLFAAVAGDTVLTSLFEVGWPDAPHRVLRNSTFERWVEAGRPAPGERPGEGDEVAVGNGRAIVRYADAQPTRDTIGDVEAMPMYAGGVRHERQS